MARWTKFFLPKNKLKKLNEVFLSIADLWALRGLYFSLMGIIMYMQIWPLIP